MWDLFQVVPRVQFLKSVSDDLKIQAKKSQRDWWYVLGVFVCTEVLGQFLWIFSSQYSAVVMCCSRAVIEGLWLRFQGEQVEVCVRRERRRRILQTLVWFIITLVLALFIPDIGRVISLIGGLAACFIFVFPGTLHSICSGFLCSFY